MARKSGPHSLGYQIQATYEGRVYFSFFLVSVGEGGGDKEEEEEEEKKKNCDMICVMR